MPKEQNPHSPNWKEILNGELDVIDCGYVIPHTLGSLRLWTQAAVFSILANPDLISTQMDTYLFGDHGVESDAMREMIASGLKDVLTTNVLEDHKDAYKEALKHSEAAVASMMEKGWYDYRFEYWHQIPVKAGISINQIGGETPSILLTAPLTHIGEKLGLPTRILYREQRFTQNYFKHKDDVYTRFLSKIHEGSLNPSTIETLFKDSFIYTLFTTRLGYDRINKIFISHGLPTSDGDSYNFYSHFKDRLSIIVEQLSEDEIKQLTKPFTDFPSFSLIWPLKDEGQAGVLEVRFFMSPRQTLQYDVSKNQMVGDFHEIEKISLIAEARPSFNPDTTQKHLLNMREQAVQILSDVALFRA